MNPGVSVPKEPGPYHDRPVARTAALPLVVRGLRKSFGDREAVSDLSFTVQGGEVFGLLGPNGAGKTTTLSVIATQRQATAGVVEVFGIPVSQRASSVRRRVGIVPQEVSLYPQLTAEENLRFLARMYDVPSGVRERRIRELLARVGLEERRGERVETFSGGMKRRLNLVASLLHEPGLLLLDEPTVGVDAHSRENILGLVRELRGGGTAVLYTTHYLEEAERLCDRMAILDEGRIRAQGTLGELLAQAGGGEVIEVRGAPEGSLGGLCVLAGVRRVEDRPGQCRIVVDRAAPLLAPLHEALGEEGRRQASVSMAPLRLENVFLELTGKALRD